MKQKNDLDEYRDLIVSNYNNALAGKNNCIPFIFPKMQQYYPGHDKGMLLGITGSAKSGKTALVSQMFFYSTMDYLYKNPDAFSVHFLWFALEESKRKFFARLDSYLLNKYYGIRVDYNTLMSKTADKRMSEEIFKVWTSEEYKYLVDFYTERLTLVKYKKTSEAILNEINKFASGLGHVIKEKGEFDAKRNMWKSTVVGYEPSRPDAYIFVVIDNLTNLQATREEYIKYNAIEHLCNELVSLKDLYNFSFILLIQQNIKETGNLKAFMNDNILSTAAGIRDYPSLEADCTDLWCISNPGVFPQLRWYPQIDGYDLDAFERNYFRVMQITASRNGEVSPAVPMFFDGATSSFEMLPPPDDERGLQKFYDKIKSFKNN